MASFLSRIPPPPFNAQCSYQHSLRRQNCSGRPVFEFSRHQVLYSHDTGPYHPTDRLECLFYRCLLELVNSALLFRQYQTAERCAQSPVETNSCRLSVFQPGVTSKHFLLLLDMGHCLNELLSPGKNYFGRYLREKKVMDWNYR